MVFKGLFQDSDCQAVKYRIHIEFTEGFESEVENKMDKVLRDDQGFRNYLLEKLPIELEHSLGIELFVKIEKIEKGSLEIIIIIAALAQIPSFIIQIGDLINRGIRNYIQRNYEDYSLVPISSNQIMPRVTINVHEILQYPIWTFGISNKIKNVHAYFLISQIIWSILLIILIKI